MKILVFKLDDEYVDSAGDCFPTDAKVEFKGNVPLVHDFSKDVADHLGNAQLVREGNDFYITNLSILTTDKGEVLKKLIKQADIYPAIGGIAKKRDDKKVLDLTINMVSFSGGVNADHRILSVKEQLKGQV